MFCKNCGNQLPDGAAFCSVCGASVNGTDAPMEVHEPVQPAHPMKWHKFLIYFQLFAAAILNALNAVQFFAGLFSDPDGFGAWSAIYIFYGVAYAVTAVLAIYARFRLAGFRQNGPKAYLAFLCVNCALNALNLVNAIGTEIYAVSSAVSALLTTVVMIILTNIYYKKRADMFVN